jgi:alkylhydroperoxidase family enzyme
MIWGLAMTARISPAEPPFAPEIQERLDRLMPRGVAPLALFTTLARDKRLFQRFMAGGLLDGGHLTLRQREIIIDRVTALCGCEYEWGVHIAFFAKRAGLDQDQIASTVTGGAADRVWSHEDRLLLTVCDALHRGCDIDDANWAALQQRFSAEAILEILMLAGYYRTVSYLSNALRLPLEPYGARFPETRSP